MRDEFQGNVCFVPTSDFARKPEESPISGPGHHEFGNAETYFLVGDALGKGMLSLFISAPSMEQNNVVPPFQSVVEDGEMAGYLLVPHEKVPETFNAGFSLYAAA